MEQLVHDNITILFTLAAVLLPLFAFVINILFPGKSSGWIATGAIILSCFFSICVFSKVWNVRYPVHQHVLWFTIGSVRVNLGILLNNLSVLMLLLVNLIALPVHIYSIAYMRHDANYPRYFAFLSFFCFSMLALVVVDNLLLFYIFWELVGFSSYLLIGFWFTREKAVLANKKAFIMNRIGDMGLLIAIIIIFVAYHTLDIDLLFGQAHVISLPDTPARSLINGVLTNYSVDGIADFPAIWQYIACGGIFLAVAAKSAQFPLHTWLPDAMEGPTSVSALIHAATMVAAGVFLLGRVYPLFNQTELTILAVIGCFTAFMAATIALTQNDLKRILAFSTISQLGYMVMAMGIGAYASSLFHLVTHAFFKCLLFLVAGIVIHQMAHIRDDNNLNIDPQNIQNMGGLRKKLPFTFIAALIGGLALVGFPLTSGFLSKDGILIQAFEWSDGKSAVFKLIPVFAILTTLLTSFYVARMIVKVFFGKLRVAEINPAMEVHISDGGWLYKLPLLFLAVCCLFPFFSSNPLSAEQSWLMNGFLKIGVSMPGGLNHFLIPTGVNIAGLIIILFAYGIYSGKRNNPFPQSGLLFNLSYNEWYFDRIYNKLIIKPILFLSYAAFWVDRRIIDDFIIFFAKTAVAFSKLAAWTDRRVINGFINLLVVIVQAMGNFVRRFQGGKVQYYIFSMLVVILAIMAWVLI